MTEQEAREVCARHSAEHPDRETHHWVPLPRDGEWVAAKIALPPPGDSTAETRAGEKPPTPDDPRSIPWLNPPSGGIA